MSAQLPPLFVDLDGTLAATDTLWESLVATAKKHPAAVLAAFMRLPGGKAGFKATLAPDLVPDASSLPLRPEVVELLEKRRAAGQRIVLATGANRLVADAVADRCRIFDSVLASDDSINLIGAEKLKAIRALCPGEFDYIGDSRADLVLFRECREGILAGGNRSVLAEANRQRPAEKPLTVLEPARAGHFILRALRPHQWVKNLLIAVPLVVSHNLGNPAALVATLVAFLAFSAIASSVYLCNDLLDLPSDRIHPKKRNRPLASGALPIPAGIALGLGTLVTGIGVAAAFSNREFLALLTMYFVISSTYSIFLKRKLLIDVFVLAGLYTIRIIAGSAAIGVRPSEWLLAFSIFIFTSLAMLKRYVELNALRKRSSQWSSGRGYHVTDIDLFRSAGLAAAYAGVLIFCLYISSPAVATLYRQPGYLWLVCGVILYWLSRLWFLTNRTRPMDDPVLFAITDRASLGCGAMSMVLVYLAT